MIIKNENGLTKNMQEKGLIVIPEKRLMDTETLFTFSPLIGSEASFREIDWVKLYNIIEFDKKVIKSVSAGMSEDWFWTACTVYERGKGHNGYIYPNEVNVHAASNWAVPSVMIQYTDGDCIEVEMWRWGNNYESYFDFMGGKQNS